MIRVPGDTAPETIATGMGSASSVQVGLAGDTAWVRVVGRGSFQNSAGLKEFANEMTRLGHRKFVVDLKQCELMDSTFMGMLAGIALRIGDQGSVKITGANTRNRQVLTNLGLDRILTVESGSSAPPQPADLHDASAVAGREAIIKAHENLVTVDPENAVRFKDVLEFLKDQKAEEQGSP